MFLIRLIRFFTGYVIFSAKGGFPERFINLCSQRGINIWDAKASGGVLTAKTSPKCYKQIRPCARNSGMKVRIKQKIGMPFLLRPYIKRRGIAVGIALSAVILVLLNSVVWTVSVTGNEKYTDSQIIALAESYGVYPGAFRKNIDLKYIRSDVKENIDGISWFSVNINGADVSLEVSEATGSNEIVDRSTPCNIVSGVDGELLRIEAYTGKSEISPGSAVTKGDLLIGGVVEKTDGTPIFVHARGTAVIRTKRTVSENIPYSIHVNTIGQIKKVCKIYLFSLEIPLGIRQNGDAYREEKALISYKGTALPLGMITCNDSFFTRTEKALSESMATLLCCYTAFREEKSFMENAETERKIVKTEKNEDNICVHIEYINHETTGIEQYFEVE